MPTRLWDPAKELTAAGFDEPSWRWGILMLWGELEESDSKPGGILSPLLPPLLPPPSSLHSLPFPLPPLSPHSSLPLLFDYILNSWEGLNWEVPPVLKGRSQQIIGDGNSLLTVDILKCYQLNKQGNAALSILLWWFSAAIAKQDSANFSIPSIY